MEMNDVTETAAAPGELMNLRFVVRLPGGATKNVTAFRRKPGGPWTIKPKVKGKQRWMSLEVTGQSSSDLALMKTRAKLRLAELAEEKFRPSRAEIAAVPKVPKIGELLDAYAAGIGLETDIGASAVADNMRRLLLLLREVRPAGAGVRTVEEARALPATVLTAELVEKFQDIRMRPAVAADAVTKGRARRTIDGTVNKARSLFTPAAMVVYRKAGLVLPDLSGFRSVPMKGNWNSASYVPIAEGVLQRMNAAAWTTLRASNRPAFLTYLLMLRCGLRNSEAEHARRCWIERRQAVVMIEGKPAVEVLSFLAITSRPGWPGPKNGRDHRVPIAADVLAELEARGGEDHLLGGTPESRADVTHRDVCDFVREFLPSVETDPEAGRVKAAYELRKHFGAMVASTQSLDRAAEYLGDRRDTVERHYHAWLQNRTARPLLASELTPNVLAAVA